MGEPDSRRFCDPGILERLPADAQPYLLRWLVQSGTRLRYAGWGASGNSGAAVLAVYARQEGDGPRKLILKFCPPDRELLQQPGRERMARQSSSPEFVEKHLVTTPDTYPAIGTPRNGWILFQEIAGGDLERFRPLTAAFDEHPGAPFAKATPVCGAAVGLLLAEWNPRAQVNEADAGVFGLLQSMLGRRLEADGKLTKWAERHPGPRTSSLQVSSGKSLLDPISLVRDPAILGERRISLLTGKRHGDLHPGNIIVTYPEFDPTSCRFIDLSRFESSGPLSYDPVHLLLSIVSRLLFTLGDDQRMALAELLVDPENGPHDRVTQGLCGLIAAVEQQCTAWEVVRDFAAEWREQRLVAVLASALIYLTRRSVRDEDRPWFYSLAAHAATALTGASVMPFHGAATMVHEQHTTRSRLDWNVPRRLTYLVPRTGPLRKVRHLLRTKRRVVIHGSPGTGKTTLATEYVSRYLGDYDHVAWVQGAETGVLVQQLVEVCLHLGHPIPAGPAVSPASLMRTLARDGRWLLVVDDVTDLEKAEQVLPRDNSWCVLLTSRSPYWSQLVPSVPLGDFTRAESISLLTRRIPEIGPSDADQLAEALDDLPLAVDQAAESLQGSSITPHEYVELLGVRAGELLHHGRVVSYPLSLTATWTLALDFLHATDPAAVQLLEVCAALGTAPVPITVFIKGASHLPDALAERSRDRLRLDQVVRAAATTGLIHVEDGCLQMHRLFHAFLRSHKPCPPDHEVRSALAAANPGNPREPATWPLYHRLFPHILALPMGDGDEPAVCKLLLDTVQWLTVTGNALTARDVATDTRDRWSAALGHTAEPVLAATSRLAQAHFHLGEHRLARQLDERVYERLRLTKGDDDPGTIAAGHDLAIDLTLEAATDPLLGPKLASRARDLHLKTVERRRHALGENHPDTQISRFNLSVEHRRSGEFTEAAPLSRDAFRLLRDVLGPDHPDTLHCAHGHALDLRTLGRAEEALKLDEDTFERRRAVLGEEHQDTLLSAISYAKDLRLARRFPEARRIDAAARAALLRLFGRDHPDTLRAAYGLGLDLRAIGEASLALELNEETLRLRREILGEQHLDTLRSYDSLARDLRAAGQGERAEELARRAHAGLERLIGPLRPRREMGVEPLPNAREPLGELQIDVGKAGQIAAKGELGRPEDGPAAL